MLFVEFDSFVLITWLQRASMSGVEVLRCSDIVVEMFLKTIHEKSSWL